MGYEAKIILDSINKVGNRLTTFEITYPRIVHNELMTHRMFSRNSSSSRAIPNVRLISKIFEDPFVPTYWGKNQKGMQAEEELSIEIQGEAVLKWIEARDIMLQYSKELSNLGIHKQIVNRLLEPWMWITVVVTATEYDNFFYLRCHKDAQPEIQKIAYMMKELYDNNKPKELKSGSWHLPYIWQEDLEDKESFEDKDLRLVSAARCARVSYLTHNGIRDISEDLRLATQLLEGEVKHISPFEHQAKALGENLRYGNFFGWKQFRKYFEDENYGKILG